MQTTMTDPNEIVRNLIENEGLEGAIQIAFDKVLRANEEHEYYELSIWREVKRDLLSHARLAMRAEMETEQVIAE